MVSMRTDISGIKKAGLKAGFFIESFHVDPGFLRQDYRNEICIPHPIG